LHNSIPVSINNTTTIWVWAKAIIKWVEDLTQALNIPRVCGKVQTSFGKVWYSSSYVMMRSKKSVLCRDIKSFFAQFIQNHCKVGFLFKIKNNYILNLKIHYLQSNAEISPIKTRIASIGRRNFNPSDPPLRDLCPDAILLNNINFVQKKIWLSFSFQPETMSITSMDCLIFQSAWKSIEYQFLCRNQFSFMIC